MNVTTKRVTIYNQELAIDAFMAMPDQQGIFPAVIVVQEIFGVNEHIRDVTCRIAKEGFVAIAPSFYQRQIAGFETGYTTSDIEIGRHYKNNTKAKELLTDLDSTIDYLYSLPTVKKTGVGAIGFCFGGHITYLGATLDRIKATASFYGAGITNWCPGEEYFTVDLTKDIKGIIYCFFGDRDQSIPLAQIEQIKQELTKCNISHKIFCYQNADHGFFCDRRGSYNSEAASLAWLEVLKLFKNNLV